MGPALQQSGRYGQYEGEDYLVARDGGWVLWTDRARPGFVKSAKGGFVHRIDEASGMQFVRIEHRGRYRGVDVVVKTQFGRSTLTVLSTDPRAREEGMTMSDRGEWFDSVPADDPDLTFTTIRTPVPAPWESERQGKGSTHG
jgi:hypothetical protein